MAKKVTLETLAKQLAEMDACMERGFGSLQGQMDKGFAAVADDIARLDDRMDGLATKDQVFALQTQVNSIEKQLRATRAEERLGKLEEKVFGSPHR